MWVCGRGEWSRESGAIERVLRDFYFFSSLGIRIEDGRIIVGE
jgi:hypothetical protein